MPLLKHYGMIPVANRKRARGAKVLPYAQSEHFKPIGLRCNPVRGLGYSAHVVDALSIKPIEEFTLGARQRTRTVAVDTYLP